MQRVIWPILGIILLALIIINLKSAQPSKECRSKAGFTTILLNDGSFSPDKIIIKKCTEVFFKNVGTVAHWPASDPHPTHDRYPEFDLQEAIAPGKSWSFVFNKVGGWRYHDHLSPSTKGIVIVNN